MKNAEQLDKAVRLLREADADCSAPEFLETRLRAVFRERYSGASVPRTARWRIPLGLVLASVLAALAVWRLATSARVTDPVAPRSPVAAARPPVENVVKQSSAASIRAATSTPSRRVRSASGTSPKQPRLLTPEPVSATVANSTVLQTEEFIAIPFAPPITAQDRGEVIRLGVPRQSLRSLGIPVNADRMFERVPADVLVGQDGIPRGIRLVGTSEPR